MKSARINFGQPNTEYKLEINDAGEATSCYNQDTETEYIGGGGDFSTVAVTIINNLSEAAVSDEPEPVLMEGAMASAPIGAEANSSMTWNMITYQGVAHILYPPIYNISIEGDAEADEDILVTVSGDCTLTFN